MAKRIWRPVIFRWALADREMTVADLHRRLLARLTDSAPSLATVYTWAQDGSRGPSIYWWIEALSNILALDQTYLFTGKPSAKGRKP